MTSYSCYTSNTSNVNASIIHSFYRFVNPELLKKEIICEIAVLPQFFREANPAYILRSNVIEKAQIAFPITSLRMNGCYSGKQSLPI